jgi:hypothetical protein
MDESSTKEVSTINTNKNLFPSFPSLLFKKLNMKSVKNKRYRRIEENKITPAIDGCICVNLSWMFLFFL